MAYTESLYPGFSDFEQTGTLLQNELRLIALGALSRVESQEQIQQRIQQIDAYRRSKMADSNLPGTRLLFFAITGDIEAAVQDALEEFSSKPAIAIAEFDLTLGQPHLANVVADPRVQEALKLYQEEKAEAARDVAAYLAGLDSY